MLLITVNIQHSIYTVSVPAVCTGTSVLCSPGRQAGSCRSKLLHNLPAALYCTLLWYQSVMKTQVEEVLSSNLLLMLTRADPLALWCFYHTI